MSYLWRYFAFKKSKLILFSDQIEGRLSVIKQSLFFYLYFCFVFISFTNDFFFVSSSSFRQKSVVFYLAKRRVSTLSPCPTFGRRLLYGAIGFWYPVVRLSPALYFLNGLGFLFERCIQRENIRSLWCPVKLPAIYLLLSKLFHGQLTYLKLPACCPYVLSDVSSNVSFLN